MKTAYLDIETGLVELVIVVNSLDDVVPKGKKLLEIPLVDAYNGSQEEQNLFNILKEIDPEYIDSEHYKIERTIYPGITKWSEERGFYEE